MSLLLLLNNQEHPKIEVSWVSLSVGEVPLLVDVFDTTDTAKWTYGAGATVGGGNLNLTHGSAYARTISTSGTWKLTDSRTRIGPVTVDATSGNEFFFTYGSNAGLFDASNQIQFIVSFGTLYARVRLSNGTSTDVSIPWTNGNWLQMRESGGTLYFETAGSEAGLSTPTLVRSLAVPFSLDAGYWQVAAGNNTANTTISTIGGINPSDTTTAEPPGVPEWVTSVAFDDTTMQVSWGATTGTVTGFQIERDGETTPILVGTSTNIYKHTGLAPNSQHSYRVRSTDGTNFSDWVAAPATVTAPTRTGHALAIPAYWAPPFNLDPAPAGTVIVANPSSGPGTAQQTAYTNEISTQQAAGRKVVGYVSTAYGKRTVADVKADIDKWYSFYPAIDGIFLDEQTNTLAGVTHYANLYNYVRGKDVDGIIVANPGQSTIEAYTSTANILMTFENTGTNHATHVNPEWMANYSRFRFWDAVHTTATIADMRTVVAKVRSTGRNVGWTYITDKIYLDPAVDNPWDVLAIYWKEEVYEVTSVHKSGADTISSALSEASSTVVQISSTDTISSVIEDASQTIFVSASASDIALPVISDVVQSTFVSINVSDSIKPVIVDTIQATFVTTAASDIVTPIISDVVQSNLVSTNASETISSGVTDAVGSTNVLTAVSDVIAAVIVENTNISTIGLGEDSLVPGLTEEATISKSGLFIFEANDIFAPIVVDSSVVSPLIEATDTATAGLGEAFSFATTVVTSTDTLTSSVNDNASIVLTPTNSDTVSFSIGETSTIDISGLVTKDASDSVNTSVSEASLVAIPFIASDSVGTSITDAAEAPLASGGHNLSATDTIDTSLSEVSTVAVFISQDDSTLPVFTEVTAFGIVSVTGSDSVKPVLIETSQFAPVVVTGSDNVTTGVTDQSLVSSTSLGQDIAGVSVTEESSAIKSGLAVVDTVETLSVETTESSIVAPALSQVDHVSASLVEVSEVQVYLSFNDNLTTTLTDDINIMVYLASNEPFSTSIVEQSSIATTTPPILLTSSDSVVAGIVEGPIRIREPRPAIVKTWNNSEWLIANIKIWNGTGWIVPVIKVWDGIAWV